MQNFRDFFVQWLKNFHNNRKIPRFIWKIPKYLLNKDLETSLRTELNSIVPQEIKVKKILSSMYNLTDVQLEKIKVIIKETDLGVGNMIDDHAISSVRLSPE